MGFKKLKFTSAYLKNMITFSMLFSRSSSNATQTTDK